MSYNPFANFDSSFSQNTFLHNIKGKYSSQRNEIEHNSQQSGQQSLNNIQCNKKINNNESNEITQEEDQKGGFYLYIDSKFRQGLIKRLQGYNIKRLFDKDKKIRYPKDWIFFIARMIKRNPTQFEELCMEILCFLLQQEVSLKNVWKIRETMIHIRHERFEEAQDVMEVKRRKAVQRGLNVNK